MASFTYFCALHDLQRTLFLCLRSMVSERAKHLGMLFNILYNALLGAVDHCLRLMALAPSSHTPSKLKRFARGRRGLLSAIESDTATLHDGRPVIWMHASSLGEYAILRPVIKQLRARMDCHIVLTFFSPTGYEALCKHHPDVDYVCYLPLDRPGNVKRFLDAVKPTRAIFAVSEYWINFLKELKRRQIPTYLLSAIIADKGPFFRWYGTFYRQALETYTHITVLNQASADNLRRLGFERYSVAGDPLFDNAVAVAETPYENSVVTRFAQGRKLFVVGSLSDENDLRMTVHLIDRHPDVRFLIVPHEVSDKAIARLQTALPTESVRYTQCDEYTDLTNRHVLIVDFVGALASLYRYAGWAYVGGGFTPYLHSIIEPVVYGIPVAYGPRIERKATPTELSAQGIGRVVQTPEELEQWFAELKTDEERLQEIDRAARHYIARQRGATQAIIDQLMSA